MFVLGSVRSGIQGDNDVLLVAEGFDGIEAGRFPGWIHAETDSDQRAHQQRGDILVRR
jgi:hypothetical protein